jgi:MFS family permease
MAMLVVQGESQTGLLARKKLSSVIATTLAAAVLVAGLLGHLTAAWGYGLFIAGALLLGAGLGLFLVFLLTRQFETAWLRGSFIWLLRLGAWVYVFAVSALAGYYTNEALNGRVGYKWMLFGPAILLALIVLDWGLYRFLVQKNLPTWQRFGHLISRERSDPEAMRQTLADEVVLHRTLFSVSQFRWLRHTLIFWGFVLLFLTDVVAVFFREARPAFGLPDIWEQPGHPLRLAFDFVFDFTGLMVLVGCVLALAFRVVVNGTERQKFTDTPTSAFLLLIVLLGFVVEGLRIASEGSPSTAALGFVGYGLSFLLPARGDGTVLYDTVWLVHVLGSCAFIAYVPLYRLVHSCATPIGRLMNSQKGLLSAKKIAVLGGLSAVASARPHTGPKA